MFPKMFLRKTDRGYPISRTGSKTKFLVIFRTPSRWELFRLFFGGGGVIFQKAGTSIKKAYILRPECVLKRPEDN